MTTWEYATVPLLPHNTKQILDNWGEDGWELVTVHTAEVGGTVAFFMPPLKNVTVWISGAFAAQVTVSPSSIQTWPGRNRMPWTAMSLDWLPTHTFQWWVEEWA